MVSTIRENLPANQQFVGEGLSALLEVILDIVYPTPDLIWWRSPQIATQKVTENSYKQIMIILLTQSNFVFPRDPGVFSRSD